MIGSPLFPLFKIFPDDCTYNIPWKGELCKHHVLVVPRRSKAINRINQCGVDSVLFTILMLVRLKDSLNHIGRTRNTSFTHCFSPSLFVESLPVNLYSRENSATYNDDERWLYLQAGLAWRWEIHQTNKQNNIDKQTKKHSLIVQFFVTADRILCFSYS